MATPISDEQFRRSLATFARTAFYLEAQEHYALGYEEDDLARFRAGRAVPPPDVDWWRPWLEQVTRLTREGKQVSRVRVVAEPPSDYQRWGIWALPWHARAGERITYMPRGRAGRAGLPLDADWWLLDDEQVILLRYSGDGVIVSKELITDPGEVARYREWRDLAVRNATPAEEIAAA